MEPSLPNTSPSSDYDPVRNLYILCTVRYDANRGLTPLPDPSVIAICPMTLDQKIETNSYSWLRKAGQAWLSVEEFADLYPVVGKMALVHFNPRLMPDPKSEEFERPLTSLLV